MKNFLNYYHDELLFLRQKGGAFAKNHPEIADKLDIKNGESADPQTERIIESVAFMSAKLNQKIDDNAQNIAFHLLSALYPNLISTFPPCGIVKFEPDESVNISDSIFIDRETQLFVKTKNGNECQFKTLYPLDIYPISIQNVGLTRIGPKLGGVDGWSLEVKIVTNSVPIELMALKNLLFHINTDIIDHALMIYEALFRNPERNVFLKVRDRIIKIPPSSIIQCGFKESETVCSTPSYSTNSFQLFQEMLHFKRKFMFFRILRIDKLINSLNIDGIDELSIYFDVDLKSERLLEIVKNDSIILNATPIVNLFQVTSDPFRFDRSVSKYLLLADQTRDSSIEIHSIEELHKINDGTKVDELIQPYFALTIDSDTNVTHDLYWVQSKEPSEIRSLEGFDTYISFVDTKMAPHSVYSDVVYAKTLCTNRYATRDIPSFSKMYVDNIETGGYHATLLHKTTEPISFSENSSSLWNLISQLTSTHMSVSKTNNLMKSIRSIANLFSTNDPLKADELFRGLLTIQVNDIVKRFGEDAWRGFIKGKVITLEIDEESSYFSYFLGCILNQYLSDIVSINSFVELKMISSINKTTLANWPSTSGKMDII